MRKLSRREALKLGAGAAAGLGGSPWLAGCGGESAPPASPEDPPLSVCQGTVVEPAARVAAVRGADLYAMTRDVLNLLGGIQTVVGEGESVFIKPNMVTLPFAREGWDPFREGECTKVEILVALAEECLRVGASEVTIGDGSQAPRFDWSRATTLDGSTHLAREADRLSARSRRDVRVS